MPKKVLTLNDFSGGLNTDKSDRTLEDNELAECTNFDVSSKGKIVASRIFKSDDTTYGDQNGASTQADAGYGLFTFSNDKLISADTTTNVGEFLVSNEGVTVDILEIPTTGTDSDAWQDDVLGGNDIGARVAYYAAEGDLFVGGTDAASPPAFVTPASLVYHKQQQVPSAGGGIPINIWKEGTQAKPVPTVADTVIFEALGTGTTEGGMTPNGQNDLHWIIKNSGSTQGSGAAGLWTNVDDGTAYYEYAASWLYKNDAESDLVKIQNHSNDASNTGDYGQGMFGATSFTDKAVTVQAWINHATPTTEAVSYARYGARLYTRLATEGGDWFLLAEMNFEKGIKGDGETEWSPWVASTIPNGSLAYEHDAVGDMCTTGDISAPPKLLTYKILNGHSTGDIPDSDRTDEKDRLVKWKTGLIANSRAYIGNVEINGRPHGDRILKSPVFQYDVFTEDDYLDVAINDGDQITALAAHGDRILEFKNSAVYIINVSKELEFLEDEQQGAGVSFQAAVTTTPFGVVWVNTNGCYLFDGEKITQLQLGKISASDWSTNVTFLATIGYDSEHQQVIVLWASSAETSAYVFDAETGGWYLVADMVNTAVNTTNMVNARGNKLLVGGGAAVDDINFLADRTGAATGFSLKTKVFDLGNPESKKNLLEVAVVYKNGTTSTGLPVKVNTWADDGTATSTTVGYLSADDTPYDTAQFDTSSTAALQGNKVYQIEIAGTCQEDIEITSISLVYRDLGVH